MARTSSALPTLPLDRAVPRTGTTGADLFSPDYAVARARFHTLALRAGITPESLPLDARGPRDESLAIDIAWLGARRPQRVVLHVCGVHGVEAYAGAATQLALLTAPPPLPAGSALILIHVLNPYGMAWLRRANENNVDLNRNFQLDDSFWSGAPPLYKKLDALLNPASPPTRDAFMLRLALAGMRHGAHAVRQAIAHGQHRYPRGLFYGGAELQQGPRRFINWLQEHLGATETVFGIDMHTGLGSYGKDTLICEPGAGTTPAAALEHALQRAVLGDSAAPAAYTVRGSLGAALPRILPQARLEFVLQEIGTHAPLRVIHALREENRWHHYGKRHPDHPAKQQLREALCPAAPEWREAAVSLGTDLVFRASAWLFGGKQP